MSESECDVTSCDWNDNGNCNIDLAETKLPTYCPLSRTDADLDSYFGFVRRSNNDSTTGNC